jgi:hypothetical protein
MESNWIVPYFINTKTANPKPTAASAAAIAKINKIKTKLSINPHCQKPNIKFQLAANKLNSAPIKTLIILSRFHIMVIKPTINKEKETTNICIID